MPLEAASVPPETSLRNATKRPCSLRSANEEPIIEAKIQANDARPLGGMAAVQRKRMMVRNSCVHLDVKVVESVLISGPRLRAT